MENTKKPRKTVECVNIEDKDIRYVLLDGGKYKIDGKIINVKTNYRSDKEMVAVENINDIRIVNEHEYIEKYISGEEVLTVEEYEDKKHELLMKKNWNKYDESSWETLEDEFAFRKFISTWTPIKSTMQTISNPIEVEEKKTQYDTGNKYIKSCFLNGESKDINLFSYDRYEAVLSIVRECFNELGMVYQKGINYSGTGDKKIWGNSDHSCIRFVVAFDGYVFDDRWDIKHSPKGTLKDMTNMYNEDKKEIRNTIISKYNKCFGKVDLEEFDFDKLLNKLKIAHGNLYSISPKKNHIEQHNKALKTITECITQITESYKENK